MSFLSRCTHCGHCSWPEQVARSRATLPSPWREELLEIEREEQSPVPDALWVAALLKWESGNRDRSALNAIVGAITDDDRYGAGDVLRKAHPEMRMDHAEHS
ncbi:hypothetical protein JKG47_01155 [Acidithiobacillus sp. MC6.1]|nr:hypothetical protein [Acidithiobacillus sp. MC6.1]